MVNIIIVILRLPSRTPAPLLPLPVACLIVSLIWFWVRVSLGMPADTPLFHDRYWIFGDGLAMALGIGGIVFIVSWIIAMVINIMEWIKGIFR